ncbi:MAG: LysM peptidoglycan-binding domain-containing protein [Planctomycetes bacterium]|nr:LysM peptidoglycan-binding domain-containing protein [Planctomycetota bacterium]
MGNVGNIEKVMVFGILGIIIIILGIAIWGDNERDGLPYDTATAQQGGAGDKLGVTVPPGDTRRPAAENQPFVYVPEVTPDELKAVPQKPPADVTASRKEAPVLVEPPQPERPKTYKVEKDDTFESIAVKLFGDAAYTDELMKANEDIDPRKMRVGQVLNVPRVEEPAAAAAQPAAAKPESSESAAPAASGAPASYTAKAGDTLFSITKQLYGSSRRWREIWELNKKLLPEPQDLRPGMVLQLPKD